MVGRIGNALQYFPGVEQTDRLEVEALDLRRREDSVSYLFGNIGGHLLAEADQPETRLISQGQEQIAQRRPGWPPVPWAATPCRSAA